MDKTATLTPKAQQTKELILTTALNLFATKGYGETTLRNIASEAGVSLGLAYRYFERKEDLVFALYERLSAACAEQAAHLNKGPLTARYEEMVNVCLDQLEPHRASLESLFAVGLSATSEIAVLGKRSESVRIRMIAMYEDVIKGSTDRLRPQQVDQIKTLLYAVHLLIVFFWLQDRSENQTRTRELLKVIAGLLKFLKPILALKPLSNALDDVSRILGPMFGGSSTHPEKV